MYSRAEQADWVRVELSVLFKFLLRLWTVLIFCRQFVEAKWNFMCEFDCIFNLWSIAISSFTHKIVRLNEKECIYYCSAIVRYRIFCSTFSNEKQWQFGVWYFATTGTNDLNSKRAIFFSFVLLYSVASISGGFSTCFFFFLVSSSSSNELYLNIDSHGKMFVRNSVAN